MQVADGRAWDGVVTLNMSNCPEFLATQINSIQCNLVELFCFDSVCISKIGIEGVEQRAE